MQQWQPPQKPAELTEARLIQAILDDVFPINSNLPSERVLAVQLGTTRPTLREALQRLSRDGWLEIRHGKPTRVRDYWQEGNLSVLAAVAGHSEHLPQHFVRDLLQVRILLAPTYIRLAIEREPVQVESLLAEILETIQDAPSFTRADWQLHFQCTRFSGNPVFTLILNGFKDLYALMGEVYFSNPEACAVSRNFYTQLLACARSQLPQEAETLTRQVMEQSLRFWLDTERAASNS